MYCHKMFNNSIFTIIAILTCADFLHSTGNVVGHVGSAQNSLDSTLNGHDDSRRRQREEEPTDYDDSDEDDDSTQGQAPATQLAARGALRLDNVPLSPPIQDIGVHYAERGEVVGLRRLHARGVLLNLLGTNGRTPATAAAAHGHINVLQYLNSIGVNLNERDRFRETPRAAAIAHSQIAALNYLRNVTN